VRDVINGVPPGKRWMHAFTYSGHPTCCAVALSNLDIIEREGLVERSAAGGARLLEKLRALEALEAVGHVRGQGLIAAVEVVADKTTRSLFPAEAGMTQKLTDAMLDRGVYTRVAMDCICIAPPLVTTDAQLDQIVDTVRDAVTHVVGAVKRDLSVPARS
jgi:adenosylmethionine-8-amino-7-oxononanoate aminotransferase